MTDDARTDRNTVLREALAAIAALPVTDVDGDDLVDVHDVHQAISRLLECRFDCLECGHGVSVDEDGCCVSCGEDAQVIVGGKPS